MGETSITEKCCTRCGQTKPLDDFYRDAAKRDGRASRCIPCAKYAAREHHRVNGAAQRQRARRRYQSDPEARRRKDETTLRCKVKRLYGLTVEEYRAILAKGCAICGSTDKRMVLDHDHASGKVRDALCHACNVSLGLMADDPARLRLAADYLENHV